MSPTSRPCVCVGTRACMQASFKSTCVKRVVPSQGHTESSRVFTDACAMYTLCNSKEISPNSYLHRGETDRKRSVSIKLHLSKAIRMEE